MSQTNKRAHPQQRPPQRRPAADSQRPPQRPPQRQSAAQQPRGVKSAPARSASRFSGGTGMLILFGAIAVIAAYFLQCAWPNGFPLVKRETEAQNSAPAAITEIHASGPIRINEIMTANGTALSAADGSMPDWIEVINTGRNSVNLSGWKLAKTANSVNVFTFPDQPLAPDECVLIYADSRLRDAAGEEYHAPFRLSSAGDTLMLFNDAGSAVDTVNIPALTKDHSYARTDASHWAEEQHPTPGLENTAESYRMLTEKSENSPVIVSELMASNRKTLTDENGQYYDYIELYNRSGSEVSLSGWYLSDDRQASRKWRFPDVSIGAGEYMVVFASGLDRKDDPAHLHTGFSLSSEGECVVLSNAQGQIMDIVEYDLLKRNQAYSLQSDGSWTANAAPTPGKANQ